MKRLTSEWVAKAGLNGLRTTMALERSLMLAIVALAAGCATTGRDTRSEDDRRSFDAIVAYSRAQAPAAQPEAVRVRLSHGPPTERWVEVRYPAELESLYLRDYDEAFLRRELRSRDRIRCAVAEDLLLLRNPIKSRQPGRAVVRIARASGVTNSVGVEVAALMAEYGLWSPSAEELGALEPVVRRFVYGQLSDERRPRGGADRPAITISAAPLLDGPVPDNFAIGGLLYTQFKCHRTGHTRDGKRVLLVSFYDPARFPDWEKGMPVMGGFPRYFTVTVDVESRKVIDHYAATM